jgi:hypothetical protein
VLFRSDMINFREHRDALKAGQPSALKFLI